MLRVCWPLPASSAGAATGQRNRDSLREPVWSRRFERMPATLPYGLYARRTTPSTGVRRPSYRRFPISRRVRGRVALVIGISESRQTLSRQLSEGERQRARRPVERRTISAPLAPLHADERSKLKYEIEKSFLFRCPMSGPGVSLARGPDTPVDDTSTADPAYINIRYRKHSVTRMSEDTKIFTKDESFTKTRSGVVLRSGRTAEDMTLFFAKEVSRGCLETPWS